MKFGHLTVVALAPERDPRGHAVWLCDCSACGSKGKRVRAGHLAVTNSCGCLKGNRVPKKRIPLTPERLRQLLYYNSATGEFFRKTGNYHRAKTGDKAGWINSHGYLQINVDGKRYQAHRLAWFWIRNSWPSKDLDHINRDRSDNRIANLRESTRGENNANSKMQKNNHSKFKGAYQNGSGWMAQVKHNGKRHYLGTFQTPEAAHAAYCAKRRELFGEFFYGG
jgi:hypothetical protein